MSTLISCSVPLICTAMPPWRIIRRGVAASAGTPVLSNAKPEDQDKPKTQQYQVFCDEFITL